jgi:hypothetical protein
MGHILVAISCTESLLIIVQLVDFRTMLLKLISIVIYLGRRMAVMWGLPFGRSEAIF